MGLDTEPLLGPISCWLRAGLVSSLFGDAKRLLNHNVLLSTTLNVSVNLEAIVDINLSRQLGLDSYDNRNN